MWELGAGALNGENMSAHKAVHCDVQTFSGRRILGLVRTVGAFDRHCIQPAKLFVMIFIKISNGKRLKSVMKNVTGGVLHWVGFMKAVM